jgi:hypothetical protein
MNDNFDKWFMGFLIVIIIVFAGIGFMASSKRDTCRIELAKAGRSVDDILKICP